MTAPAVFPLCHPHLIFTAFLCHQREIWRQRGAGTLADVLAPPWLMPSYLSTLNSAYYPVKQKRLLNIQEGTCNQVRTVSALSEP